LCANPPASAFCLNTPVFIPQVEDEKTNRAILFEDMKWQDSWQRLRQKRHLSGNVTGPVDFSRTSPPQIAFTVLTHSGEGEKCEIWVSDCLGNKGQCVVTNEFVRYFDVRWSPDGEYLAYVESPFSITSGPSNYNRIWVAHIKTRQKWLVATDT